MALAFILMMPVAAQANGGSDTTPRTVSVGEQNGTLTAGTAGNVTFIATTSPTVNEGTDFSLNNINLIPGITLDPVTVVGSSTTIRIRTTAGTPGGTHPLTVTIVQYNITSSTFFLTVGSPTPAISVSSTGLSSLRYGQAVSDASVVYTLSNGTYAASITPANFAVSGLPSGLSAGTATKTGNTVVTVPITGTPNVVNSNPTTITRPGTIPQANVTGATAAVSVYGTVTASQVNKGTGAPVSGSPTVSGTPTHNSITVNAVTNAGSTGQAVEYGICFDNAGTPGPVTSWQSGTTFSSLAADTMYYICAHTAANDYYNAGASQYSAGITTASAPAGKTVSVGSQNGTLYAGTAGSVTYTVTTANIAAGTAISLSNINFVAGISLGTSATSGNSTTITVYTTASTPAGAHLLSLTIDGTASNSFSLVVDMAKTVSVSEIPDILPQGIAGWNEYTVTTTGIANNTLITFNNINAVTGITLNAGTQRTNYDRTFINVHTTEATPAGAHPLSLTIDGVTSNTFNLVVAYSSSGYAIANYRGGTIIWGTAGYNNYRVDSEGVADGTPITLDNTNSVPGISLDPAAIYNNGADVTIRTTAETPAGYHPLRLVVGGLKTNSFDLHVYYVPPITASSTGLGALKVGQEVSGASVLYTLSGAVYAMSITENHFYIAGLPPGLSAGTATRTSDTVVTVPITGTPTAPSAGAISLSLTLSIPKVNVPGSDLDIVPTGTLTVTVAKGDGAEVSAAPTADSELHSPSRIRVNPVTNTGTMGQEVEYAISTTSGTTPASGWQSETTFTSLAAATTYYVYARTAANDNYNAGTAQQSVGITTAAIVSYIITFDRGDAIGGTARVKVINGEPMPAITPPASINPMRPFVGYYLLGDKWTQYYDENGESTRDADFTEDTEITAHFGGAG